MTLILKQTQRVIFKRKINLSRVNHRHNIQVQIQNKFNHISHPRFSLTLLNSNSRMLNIRISSTHHLRFNRTLNNSNIQSSLHTSNSHSSKHPHTSNSITVNPISRRFTIQISKLTGETLDSMTNTIVLQHQPLMYITKTSTKTSIMIISTKTSIMIIRNSNFINVLGLTLNEENIGSKM
jgi:hypothetical protein